MLEISEAQYAAFTGDARARFRARLAAWLRVHAPGAAALEPRALLALIARQEPRAAQFGLRTQRQLAKWCILAVLTAEQFDTVPMVQDYLAAGPERTAEARLDEILRATAGAIDARNAGLPGPGM